MNTTINRDQILKLTRETLDHTLRFFNTVNENLRKVVDSVHTSHKLPLNHEDVTRVCTDFHRDHETRINKLTNIWKDFSGTVKNTLPTDITKIFDTNEVVRLNREVIDHTLRFFNTTNEALIKGQLPQHDQVLPRNILETINTAIQDFQKTQTEFTRHFETTFHNVLETVTPRPTTHHTTETRTTATNDPQHAVRDEVLTLNREIIDHTVRFFMNLNEHVAAILENTDRKNIEKHAELINRLRDEYISNHRLLIERFDSFVRRTAETLSTARLNTLAPATTNLFDHQEVLRINQDAVASTVKFFTTITENVLQGKHDNLVDHLTHATTEYQKHHQILTGRIETIWRDSLNNALNLINREPVTAPLHTNETTVNAHHHTTTDTHSNAHTNAHTNTHAKTETHAHTHNNAHTNTHTNTETLNKTTNTANTTNTTKTTKHTKKNTTKR